jgi:flagellar biosynthesis/type III secretory pathway protein FliH
MPRNDNENDRRNDSDDDAPTSIGNQDTQVAEAAGLTEGDVKALRSDAGLNQLPGHESNVQAWEASVEGQQWLADEKQREEAIEAETKAVEASAKEAEGPVKRYQEAVEKGRSQAKKAAAAAKKSAGR